MSEINLRTTRLSGFFCDRLNIIYLFLLRFNMKTQFFIAMTALFMSCPSFAETATSTTTSNSSNADLKPLSGVRVSMQRMLKSGEGRYFLSLYAGIPNPHATLYDLMSVKETLFSGTQKADQITMKSLANERDEAGKYQISGTLNVNTGIFKVLLSENTETPAKSMQFEPAFKVANKPTFIFKFYGQNDPKQPLGNTLKRVDVINKVDNSIAQSLTGFTAYAGSMGYMDINFDGYYDVILSDLSEGKKIVDKRYIYWMYNPKTNQFQRSAQMEKIVGLPELHGEKQQIDFGNGQVYQVEKGLLKRIGE